MCVDHTYGTAARSNVTHSYKNRSQSKIIFDLVETHMHPTSFRYFFSS
jgi:hypothetical protein